MAGLLDAAGRDSRVVLLLDDLHWADGPTLALLKHVLGGARPSRLLSSGTYRDSGPLRRASPHRRCSPTFAARMAWSG